MPAAVLELPVLLLKRAFTPVAVFLVPLQLVQSALAPVAVLLSAILCSSAAYPVAVM